MGCPDDRLSVSPPRSGLPRHPGVTGCAPPPPRPAPRTRPSEIERPISPTHESSDIAMTSTESRKPYANHGQIDPLTPSDASTRSFLPARFPKPPQRIRSAARLSLIKRQLSGQRAPRRRAQDPRPRNRTMCRWAARFHCSSGRSGRWRRWTTKIPRSPHGVTEANNGPTSSGFVRS